MVQDLQNLPQAKAPVRLGLLIPLFLISLLGCYGFRFFSEDPDWKTYKSDEFGFSFECPYPIELITHDTKDKKGNHFRRISGSAFYHYSIVELIATAITKKYMDGTTLSVWSLIADKKSTPFSLKKEIETAKKIQSSTAKSATIMNYQGSILPTECSGIPAVLITTAYDYCDGNGKFLFSDHSIQLIVVKGRQLWSATSNYYGNQKTYEETADRMIKSFKIIPQSTPVPKSH